MTCQKCGTFFENQLTCPSCGAPVDDFERIFPGNEDESGDYNPMDGRDIDFTKDELPLSKIDDTEDFKFAPSHAETSLSEEAIPEDESEAPKRPKKKLLVIIIAALVAVIILGTAGFILIRSLLLSSREAISGRYTISNGNFLYLSNPANKGKLYKYNKDTDECIKLSDNAAEYLALGDGVIYYSDPNEADTLCRVSTGGTNAVSGLCELPANYIVYHKGNIFFANPGENYQVYVMAGEESDPVPLEGICGQNLKISGNYMYYLENDILKYTELPGVNADTASGEFGYAPGGFDILGSDIVFSGDSSIVRVGKNKEDVTYPVTGRNPLFLNDNDIIYCDINGNVVKFSAGKEQTLTKTTETKFSAFNGGAVLIYPDSNTMYIIDKNDNTTTVELPSSGLAPTVSQVMGNVSNDGYAAVDSQYIYYYNYIAGGLFRMNFDATGFEKVVDTQASGITTSDGFIYFSDHLSGSLLQRVQPDGSGLSRITAETSSNTIPCGDWIYYIAHNQAVDTTLIRRTSRDGMITQTIAQSGKYTRILLYNNWIYYISETTEPETGETGRTISRMRTDGEYDSQILTRVGTVMTIYNDKLYYTEANSELSTAINKCNLDGSSPETVLEKTIGTFNIDKDYLYYTDDEYNNAIFKMALDGSGEAQKLNDSMSFGLNICQDYIIFISFDSETSDYAVKMIKTDGSGEQNLDTQGVEDNVA